MDLGAGDAHKTQKPHVTRISSEAIEFVRPLLEFESDTIFMLGKSGLFYWATRLFAAAEKHGFQRKRGQGLGTLRKLFGTELCRKLGLAAAARGLGHTSGTAIAEKHYVQADAIAPPESLDSSSLGLIQGAT